jgi:hypothetical protein
MTNIQQKTEMELSPKVFDLLNTPQAMDKVQFNCGVKKINLYRINIKSIMEIIIIQWLSILPNFF